MRPILPFLSLAILAACATPREQCIDDVMRDARVQAALAEQLRGNIARGYALEQRTEVRTVRTRCEGRDSNGAVISVRCNETRSFERTVPVAINLEAEQEKLRLLEARLETTRAAADQGVARCIAVHAE